MRGTGEQRQFWGTWNIGNEDCGFGEQGNKAIYFRGTRDRVPPWEGVDAQADLSSLGAQAIWMVLSCCSSLVKWHQTFSGKQKFKLLFLYSCYLNRRCLIHRQSKSLTRTKKRKDLKSPET